MKKCSSCGREFPEPTTFCPFDGKKLDAPEPIDIDKFIGMVLDGKYCIESKIGQGGMGNVYKAKHVHMDTAVAVKILHPHLVSDQTTVERFRREARAAITVNHPNAIHVMDFGVTGDKTVYLVMEFLEGVSLRRLLEIEKCLSPEKALWTMKEVCAAVEAAHSKGIIHRDLKPDNIVILNYNTSSEQIKVLDFSIAKLKVATDGPVNLTQQGMVVGTPQYMSPEQAEGQELDVRSDLYSLGVIMYEMLTGDLPFKATTPMALILKHIHALPRPLRELKEDISPALEAVVLRTLAKKRDDRPQSAQKLAEQLEEALNQKDIPAKPETAPVVVRPTGEPMSPLGIKMSGPSKPTQPVMAQSLNPTGPLIKPNEANPNALTNSGSLDYSGDWSVDPSKVPSRGQISIAPNRPQQPNSNNGMSGANNNTQSQAPIYRHAESFPEPEPKKSNRLLVMIGGVVFALVVGLAVYYFIFSKSGETISASNKDPKAWLEKMEMIAIPTGSYMMGRDPDRDVAEDATPAHQVKVPGFMLSRHEITNKQYSDFLKATNHPSPSNWTGLQYPANQDDFPVSNVSWDDAGAYCKWLSSQSGVQFRLPTEAEWEYAARGMDNRIYPWGQDWDPFKTVSSENGPSSVVAVNSTQLSADRSPFGIVGMSGNLSEWTASGYSLYPNSTAKEDDCTQCKIIRGGNFQSKDKKLLTNTNRAWLLSNVKSERIGFRVASEMSRE